MGKGDLASDLLTGQICKSNMQRMTSFTTALAVSNSEDQLTLNPPHSRGWQQSVPQKILKMCVCLSVSVCICV